MKIVTINQPCVFPRTHLLERAAVADVYIHMSSAQFVRQGDQSLFPLRKTTKKSIEEFKSRMPTQHLGEFRSVLDAQLSKDDHNYKKWLHKTRKMLKYEYSKLSGWKSAQDYFEYVVGLIEDGETSVGVVGEKSMEYAIDCMGIELDAIHRDVDVTEVLHGDPSLWVKNLTSSVGGTHHYTGEVATMKYLDFDDWAKDGMQFIPQNWKCPDYVEDGKRMSVSLFDVLVRGQSAVDLLKADFAEAKRRVVNELSRQ